jgi:hypothetical protein
MKSTKPNPQKDMIIRLNSQLTEMKRDRDRLQTELDILKKDLSQSQLKVKSLGQIFRLQDGTWQVSPETQKTLNELFPNGIKA